MCETFFFTEKRWRVKFQRELETILMCEHRVVHLRAEGGAHVALCYSAG